MNTKNIFGFFSMLLLLSANVSMAQLQAPNPSPSASVSQNVGFTKISIEYSSPGVKGRKVFGELEKFDMPWRAGANAPTTIEFSTPVSINGTNIRPGKYSIFITPKASGPWTIHLNSKGSPVFAYIKDGKADQEALKNDAAVVIEASPSTSSESLERLSYMISAEDNKTAKITMWWDKTRLSFDVDTQVDQKLDGFRGIFN
ncbi:DUF2911 domain-containing protein [Pleomorphovibrio marinus]|uniref:DUF2911 domain-containing protein n=1 Tax=Pleomorphovibrio marinus TaxID=2164132 RepID=UPI000E0A383A|nr:DUF2911 domain-containing protein [Pleomorphovibrio marinus]